MSTDNVLVQSWDIQNVKPNSPPLFALGNVVATPAALALMEKNGVAAITLLCRHQHGDWGALEKHDIAANTAALSNGSRILSAYEFSGDPIWVVTQAIGEDGVSRASTCILLPGDY